ncbi:hypothetical protein HUJ04_011599 [Dendroctonus ponderosae]|nr:hypothetical protein HUJ04_011599 [Dendroctonus ponderosae]
MQNAFRPFPGYTLVSIAFVKDNPCAEYAHKKSRRGCSSQTDEAMESILEGIPGKNQPTLNGKNSGEIDQNLSWTS